ncbi:MAG: phosphatase PAP2 family protein [Chthonomonadales bacterium]
MPRITNLHQQKWFLALAILLLLAMAIRGSRKAKVWALCLVLAIGASDLTAARVIKHLVIRERPCNRGDLISTKLNPPQFRLVPREHCPGSKSFPSNHAANMMALATVCWWFTRKPKLTGELNEKRAINPKPLLWFLIPLIVGYSRIYLGYHYPTDVIGGYLLGGIMAGLAILATKSLLPNPEGTNNAEPDVFGTNESVSIK